MIDIPSNRVDARSSNEDMASITPILSLVVPAFNEAENLPVLYQKITEVLDQEENSWELIIVDDHSLDATFSIVQTLARKDHRVRGFRLSRNRGADTAILCGLEHARGACAVFLSADMQDPPELIPDLILKWRQGAQIVGAIRAKREGVSSWYVIASHVYYFLMRRILGVKEIPSTGSDFFLLDRWVINHLVQCKDTDLCICALINWIGFRQEHINYTKQGRQFGASKQTIAKYLKRIVDSFTSFSHLPLRLISCMGVFVALIGFLYTLFIMIRAILYETPVQGWASLMVIVLVLGGIQMLMMGILGEYIWRTLDETRKRPFYMIENQTSTETEKNCNNTIIRTIPHQGVEK